MKKKLIFKKWIQNLIIITMIAAVIVCSGECESMSLFITKSLLSTLVFITGYKLLRNHTYLFESEI